ncbi:reverse transcriptase domain-containing protein [Tanacetum coccineum]
MVLATTSLTGFSRETIWPLGQLRLLVTIGDADHSTRAWMNFMIVRSLSSYNGIIRRPGIREIQAVPSIAHGMLKFPVDGGIVTIRNTILISAECATVITSSKETPKEIGVRHENFNVALHPNFPDQEVAIRGTLSAKERTELCSLLKKNLDIFAWQPSDMTGIPRSIAEHRLNIWEGYSPVRQKKRGKAPEHAKAIQAEIQMAELDEEKTTFHTSQGVYCYNKMPFSLKNASATYQRLVDKAFDSQVGRNIEVYVDDLVIKSHTEAEMLRDIDEMFRTPKGIKPFPDKTEVVLQLPFLRTIKEVQSLNGKLASLNRFLSKSAESAVLMTERGTVQTPVYFISRALQGPELNYTPTEKLVLSLVFAAKRLRRYFQAHPIAVITDQPIKQIISRPDVAGRLQKWSVMLREHNITYRPRTSVKGQILADFLIEKPDESPSDTSVVETPPKGTEFTYALRFQFTTSNNEAEYEALIAGLRIAAQMGVRNVHVKVDSKLVANQVLGAYVAKEENMIKYLKKVKSLVSGFVNFSISQVPRSKNKKADALSKIASTSFAHLSKQVLVEVLEEKSIQEEEVATVVEEEGPTWMTPIIEHLKEGTLPNDKREAIKLRIKARQYEFLKGVLYRRSFLKPWLRNPQQPLTPITAPWLFCKWGIDIAGPFPEGPGKVKFLIVAMDYFTKWIEVKAMATITCN